MVPPFGDSGRKSATGDGLYPDYERRGLVADAEAGRPPNEPGYHRHLALRGRFKQLTRPNRSLQPHLRLRPRHEHSRLESVKELGICAGMKFTIFLLNVPANRNSSKRVRLK
jgi:hypothetical protein